MESTEPADPTFYHIRGRIRRILAVEMLVNMTPNGQKNTCSFFLPVQLWMNGKIFFGRISLMVWKQPARLCDFLHCVPQRWVNITTAIGGSTHALCWRYIISCVDWSRQAESPFFHSAWMLKSLRSSRRKPEHVLVPGLLQLPTKILGHHERM